MRNFRRRDTRARAQPQRGSTLILGLFVVSIAATVITAGTTRAAGELLAANRAALQARGYLAAEAGLDCAIARLRLGTDAAQIGAACSGTVVPQADVTVSLHPQGGGLYDAVSSAQQVGAASAVALQTVLRRFNAGQSPFQQAMYGTNSGGGDTGVLLGFGALVDSYDSELGAYGGANVGASAVVQSSSPYAGYSIYVHNNSLLRGNAYTAPGGGIASFNTPPSAEDPDGNGITGATGTRAPVSFPAPVRPSAPAGCVTLGNYTVQSGADVELTGTAYCATGLQVQTGGRLRLPNVQHLYVDGNLYVRSGGQLEMGQGILNVVSDAYIYNAGTILQGTAGAIDLYVRSLRVYDHAQAQGTGAVPSNLRIYQTAATLGHTIRLESQATVHAAIYSPSAWVLIQDAGTTLYGAMIATQSGLNYGALHFDEAVAQASGWPEWFGGGFDVSLLIHRRQ